VLSQDDGHTLSLNLFKTCYKSDMSFGRTAIYGSFFSPCLLEQRCFLFEEYLIISEIMEVPFDGSQCKRLLIMEQAEDTNVTQCQQGSPPDQL